MRNGKDLADDAAVDVAGRERRVLPESFTEAGS
jgi:hypothetical protein